MLLLGIARCDPKRVVPGRGPCVLVHASVVKALYGDSSFKITQGQLSRLVDTKLKEPGVANFEDVVEECYGELGNLLAQKNEHHGVKSVCAVAYCSLQQVRKRASEIVNDHRVPCDAFVS